MLSCRPHRPRRLGRGTAAACLLRLWDPIPPATWISLLCVFRLRSPREEFYRVFVSLRMNWYTNNSRQRQWMRWQKWDQETTREKKENIKLTSYRSSKKRRKRALSPTCHRGFFWFDSMCAMWSLWWVKLHGQFFTPKHFYRPPVSIIPAVIFFFFVFFLPNTLTSRTIGSKTKKRFIFCYFAKDADNLTFPPRETFPNWKIYHPITTFDTNPQSAWITQSVTHTHTHTNGCWIV